MQPDWKSVYQLNVLTVLANTEVFAYLKDMEFNVTAQLAFQAADVKLTSTNALVNLAITVVPVPIYLRVTDVLALQDTVA